MGVNYGLNKVRFTAPVPVNSRLRGHLHLLACEDIEPTGIQMTWRVSVEREGRIVTVRIDRGDGVNALSDAVMRELTDVARSFEDEPSVGIVEESCDRRIGPEALDEKADQTDGARVVTGGGVEFVRAINGDHS